MNIHFQSIISMSIIGKIQEIVSYFKYAFNGILAILSFDDALITSEGKSFLSNSEKMSEFYKELEQEEKQIVEKK